MRLFGRVPMPVLLTLCLGRSPCLPTIIFLSTETDDQNTSLSAYYLPDDRVCQL